MYLVDTDVISEARKGNRGNAGVRAFFSQASQQGADLYLSAVTIGELRQGVERIRYRGDKSQAQRLEQWLLRVTSAYADRILPLDEETAHVWGRLRVPNPENPLDKQIAATALLHDLVVVSRNVAHYAPTGVRVRNPFT
ncbi:MAG: type II toxin-antitoxin system VapC family toxin [Gammaproteobacteria bacterium]|nr:type II toxin-antitoxin system VapC family toxin [Gammaproteobacteria bacterium]